MTWAHDLWFFASEFGWTPRQVQELSMEEYLAYKSIASGSTNNNMEDDV